MADYQLNSHVRTRKQFDEVVDIKPQVRQGQGYSHTYCSEIRKEPKKHVK